MSKKRRLRRFNPLTELPGYQPDILGKRRFPKYRKNVIDPADLVALRNPYRRNVIDPADLVALRNPYRRNVIEPSQLVALRRNPEPSGWNNHLRSNELSDKAQILMKKGKKAEAYKLYLEASEAEERAFDSISFDKPRTRGILAVSAAALAHKANDMDRAKELARKYLAMQLPDFARAQLGVIASGTRIPRRLGGGLRRNPDPEGNPWGPSLYNPLEDRNHDFKDESHYNHMISKLRRNPYPGSLYYRRKYDA